MNKWQSLISFYCFNFLFSITEEPLDFTKPLVNIEVTEGQSIVLECTLSKPNRPVTWFKKGSKVSASETIVLKSDGSNHKLTIERAELSDKGDYSIKVDGKTSKASVKVIGK